MRYGINLCTLGDYAEPGRAVELAQAAESAGWEAVFVWDHPLEVIAALWSGEPVTHRGAHYRVDGIALAPLPGRTTWR